MSELIMLVSGLVLAMLWFAASQPYTDWRERASAGLALGVIFQFVGLVLIALAFGSKSEIPICFDLIALYIVGTVAGSLLVSRGKQVTGHSKIDVPPPNAKTESAVALMVNELLQLEDDIRKLREELGSEKSYFARLSFCEDKRRDALRSLKRGQPSEARKMLDTAKEVYVRELQEAQSAAENTKLFNEAVEQLSPDKQARVLDKPKSNPYC
ncbi:MAG: hypothetical protein K2X29_07885 [Candidatus Obscuribacterales bacterium]|nr:hypothetical protein [Candidatus Obscuribacterales bacterium]